MAVLFGWLGLSWRLSPFTPASLSQHDVVRSQLQAVVVACGQALVYAAQHQALPSLADWPGLGGAAATRLRLGLWMETTNHKQWVECWCPLGQAEAGAVAVDQALALPGVGYSLDGVSARGFALDSMIVLPHEVPPNSWVFIGGVG